jgi:hypothetical protein
MISYISYVGYDRAACDGRFVDFYGKVEPREFYRLVFQLIGGGVRCDVN